MRKMALLAVFCLGYLAVGSASNAVMRAKRLAGTDTAAVCNDGSSSIYYISSGATNATDKWIIRFMGGAWCTDLQDCQSRWESQPYLMSSLSLPDELRPGIEVVGIPDVYLPLHGILSADHRENPYFADWRHVYLWYCSSDSHLGNARAGPWHFKGKLNTRTMVKDLLDHENLAEATEVLLSGDSAGGVGVMSNADLIFSLVKEKAKHLRRVKVLVDAGWFLDIPSFSKTSRFTFRGAAKALKQSWNATFNRACEEHFGPEASWRCFHAQYAWPHVPLPALYLENLYDSANLGFDAAQPRDFEPFRRMLTASFSAKRKEACFKGKRLRAALVDCLLRFFRVVGFSASVLNSPAAPNVFAPACHLHESIDSAVLSKLAIGRTNFYAHLVDWFEKGGQSSVVDQHQGVRTDGSCTGAASRTDSLLLDPRFSDS